MDEYSVHFTTILQKYGLQIFTGPSSVTRAGNWLGKLNSAYQLRLDALCGQYKRGKQRPSRFVFVIDATLNACADVYKEHELVAINNGALFILIDTFHAMLSRPELLPHIGDTSKEKHQFEHIKVSHMGIIVDPSQPPGNVDIPRYVAIDSAQQHFAMIHVHMALDFVFAHEAAHVVAGHPIYCRNVVGMNTPLFAYPAFPNRVISSYVEKSLEMDADLEGARRLAWYLTQRAGMSLIDEEIPEGLYDRFLALCIAIATYFCLVAPESYGETTYALSSHPHPYVRMAYVFSGVADKFQEGDQEIFKTWLRASTDAIDTMETAWQSIGMGDLALSSFFSDMNKIYDEVGAIHTVWRTTIPQLALYDLRQSGEGVL